jgi:hypothetical protein
MPRLLELDLGPNHQTLKSHHPVKILGIVNRDGVIKLQVLEHFEQVIPEYSISIVNIQGQHANAVGSIHLKDGWHTIYAERMEYGLENCEQENQSGGTTTERICDPSRGGLGIRATAEGLRRMFSRFKI